MRILRIQCTVAWLKLLYLLFFPTSVPSRPDLSNGIDRLIIQEDRYSMLRRWVIRIEQENIALDILFIGSDTIIVQFVVLEHSANWTAFGGIVS